MSLVAHLAILVALSTATAAAQDVPGTSGEHGIAVLHPDTVRVGESFELGVTAITSVRLQFPAVLGLTEQLEQTGPPRIARDSAGLWRAVYPMVAWTTGRLQIPDVRVAVIGPGPERQLSIRPPALQVLSVLPPPPAEPRLRPPRGPTERWSFPWIWLVAVVVLALLARELLRRLRPTPITTDAEAEPTPEPRDAFRSALLRLRARAASGEAPPADLYDELELVVRAYLTRTRGWPEQAPVRAALERPDEEARAFANAMRNAVPARFGALHVTPRSVVADIDEILALLVPESAA